MRIVNIIQRYPPAVGGSETWCREVSRHLAGKGHNVRVLTLSINMEEEYWRDPPDEERTIALGRLDLDGDVIVRRYKRSLPVHSVYHLGFKLLLDKLLKIYFYGPHSCEMYGKMWQEIKNSDIVFLHTIPYPHNYIAFAIARLLKKKTVIVPHFHPGHPFHERRSHYWLLRNCDCVITVTNFEKEYLEAKGIAGKKLFVTGNAIHPEHYLPADLDSFRTGMEEKYNIRREDKVILFIGRKMEEKGVGHLIDAVRTLSSERPVKLLLAGPSCEWFDDIYSNLTVEEKKYIADMGVVSHEEKVNLLHIADLLALPSKYEAFGIVFLEAWICGTPVIGSSESAMPSVIGDEGFLCIFGDREDIKSKIRTALNNTEESREKSKRGKAKVLRNFTWDVIGGKVEKAITETAGKKKVIFCCNAYPPHFIGGAELIAHQQAKALKELGCDVLVFAGELNNAGKRHSIRNDSFEGLPVSRVCLHAEDYSSDFFNFTHRDIEKLFDDMLEAHSPDVVHFHNIVGLSAGLIQTAKRRRLKTVLTLHDYWGICHRNIMVKEEGRVCEDVSGCGECRFFISTGRWQNVPSLMRRDFISYQLNMGDAYISPSKYLAEKYIRSGLDAKKMNVIPYGIDIERFSKVTKDKAPKKVRFSFIGYIGRHKGVITIIEALAYIKDRENIQVNFIGDGELKAELQNMVAERELNETVRFSGKKENSSIEDVFSATDVMILPSIWPDNHPVSIYEAMASSTPVIASRMGGIPELVEDGKTGCLFEAGNAKELAQKMSEFISDKSRIKEFGENGFKKISSFALKKQVNEISNLYKYGQFQTDESLKENALILCIGKKMQPECSEAIDIFLKGRKEDCKFLMADWLNEGDIKKAKLLWVVDREVSLKEINKRLVNRLPLLVPYYNEELKKLCINEKCGLYYKDEIEASVCLEFLMDSIEILSAMRQNAFKAFYKKIT
ncbi:MAG: glycosyltransferase [Nitrospirae bacterium]|nr:glycosyltransferase [Nitrospirota bacterium]